MKLRAVLVAMAFAGLCAGGALADGGPGSGGGPPPPPPPPPPAGQHDGGDVNDGGNDSDRGKGPGQRPPKGGARPAQPGSERAFRQALTAAGYTCAMRPVLLRGSLTAVAADSIKLHRARPAAAVPDVTVKLLTVTVIHRKGPVKGTSLVVGDLADVNAAACRTAGATAGTPPTLVARIVDAHPKNS